VLEASLGQDDLIEESNGPFGGQHLLPRAQSAGNGTTIEHSLCNDSGPSSGAAAFLEIARSLRRWFVHRSHGAVFAHRDEEQLPAVMGILVTYKPLRHRLELVAKVRPAFARGTLVVSLDCLS
jgi:hypothetical protein